MNSNRRRPGATTDDRDLTTPMNRAAALLRRICTKGDRQMRPRRDDRGQHVTAGDVTRLIDDEYRREARHRRYGVRPLLHALAVPPSDVPRAADDGRCHPACRWRNALHRGALLLRIRLRRVAADRCVAGLNAAEASSTARMAGTRG